MMRLLFPVTPCFWLLSFGAQLARLAAGRFAHPVTGRPKPPTRSANAMRRCRKSDWRLGLAVRPRQRRRNGSMMGNLRAVAYNQKLATSNEEC